MAERETARATAPEPQNRSSSAVEESLTPTPTERSLDAELIRRAQAGDQSAFELLVIKYQRKILRLLTRFLRDPAEIEDVAQETFIKAYRALNQFRGEAAFYTWLYRIAINAAKNHLASQNRRPTTSLDAAVNEEGETFDRIEHLSNYDTPESALATQQIAQAVQSVIQTLPEELATAITLREIDGLSYEDIAQAMECPVGTVRSRIFRAREAIAEVLRPLLDQRKGKRW